MKRTSTVAVLIAFGFLSSIVFAQEQAPLQANVRLRVNSGTVYRPPPAGRRFVVVRIQVFGNYE